MAISKLDNSWDDFFEQFMRTLLADGYDEFEILDKMMAVFKTVRESKSVAPPKVVVNTTEEVIEEIKNVSEEKKHRKYPENKKNPCRLNNPHNYDKTLHSKFAHAVVYVEGNKEASLATIEMGPNQKIRDVYKLISNGKTYNEQEYLKEFNTNTYDTPRGYSYLNRCAIVFEANPKVSVGYVKQLRNYNAFRSIEDIRRFSAKNKRK